MDVLPFSHVTLTARKPAPDGYPENPESLGEHLRKARLDRGLLQREVADQVGVNPSTIQNWENGHTQPALRHWPAVIAFLGFVPFEVGDSLGEQILAWRTIRGVPRNELADRLGVDPSTVWRWESDGREPSARHQEQINGMLKNLN